MKMKTEMKMKMEMKRKRGMKRGMGVVTAFAGAVFWGLVLVGCPKPGPVVVDDLIFIHHSVGQHWLNHSLHAALLAKPYVDERNDICYGTDMSPDADRPDSLADTPGDATDMYHWIRWFNDYLEGVRSHGCADGVNRIIMFKSCYPNSDVVEEGAEPGSPFAAWGSIVNYKAVYRHPDGSGNTYDRDSYTYLPLEDVFAANPGTLFIPVTAPPLCWEDTSEGNAAHARAFNNWLKGEWLEGYVARMGLHNVAVFDFFDVLAHPDGDPADRRNRLRSAYGGETGNSHPNDAGDAAATAAFATGGGNFLDVAWAAFTGGRKAFALASGYVPYESGIVPSAPGYGLPLDLGLIENYATVDGVFGGGALDALLERNGFAIMDYEYSAWELESLGLEANDDFGGFYLFLAERRLPVFITSDTLLHLYHVQFDETLKEIEETEFLDAIGALTDALLRDAQARYAVAHGDLQEAARRNVAYLAVAKKLIDPAAAVPPLVADVVTAELAKIDAHAGFQPSDVFIYEEDYSQYVPRGHYTRSEDLEKYFRTLMWYGRMAFLLKGGDDCGPGGDALISEEDARVQTMQAAMLADALRSVPVGERVAADVWERIYSVTAFYVGVADDLTPFEYLGAINKVYGSTFQPADLEDAARFHDLKSELALLRSPQIFGGTGNPIITPPVTPETLNEILDKTKGMRLMGQRFIPDSYMFQQLVFPAVTDYLGAGAPFTLGYTGARFARCYPRGLDVLAVMGSAPAAAILVDEGDTEYDQYEQQFAKLRGEFAAFGVAEWNRNLYWGWLYSLGALVNGFPEGYPDFMRTEAWDKKELNAALASWAELRHDTILYAKQSYTGTESGAPGPPPGYVEPVPEFYGRLLALTCMTREGLGAMDALSDTAENRLLALEAMLERLIEIAEKELTNLPLSAYDKSYIECFGETLETVVLGVEEEGVKSTLVADVHTHSYEASVVEEGVGYVDVLVCAFAADDGRVYLGVGPVFSYYEFKHPMSDRLTDEAWRDVLASPDRPRRPPWTQDIVVERGAR